LWHEGSCAAAAARLADDVKAVQLREQLHERALDLAVRARALAEAPPADRVDLVHEDDARLVLLRMQQCSSLYHLIRYA
jgi:hypothetical protein